MMYSATVAPPYSMVVVEDSAGGELPDFMEGSVVFSSESCIVVCCLMSADGDTTFTLGQADEVDPGTAPLFQGKLETPSRRITIKTVENKTFLEAPVSQISTTVRIWVNRAKEPDRVIVGIE